MRRREFITLFGGAAVTWPLVGRAQERSSLLPRIGYLVVGTADDQEAQVRFAAFREALERTGLV
jgi:putative tryptophan/tyrosine transport system substrate-binding protein